jgi:DNA invertase Pin-like site-specific DNA recombinase
MSGSAEPCSPDSSPTMGFAATCFSEGTPEREIASGLVTPGVFRDQGSHSEASEGPLARTHSPSATQRVQAIRAEVVGYASMPGEQPGRCNEEFRRQAEVVAYECERRGLSLLEIVREHEPRHVRPLERSALGYALRRIAAGEASGLVVSDLFRVGRSLPELGRVLEWLFRRDARFLAVAPGLDTDEEAGWLAVRTIIDVSGWERQRLVERTRRGMRAASRKGPASVADYPQLRERIARMRADGMALQAIADQLNGEGVPTVRGGAKWRPSSVQAAAGYQRRRTSSMLDLRLER